MNALAEGINLLVLPANFISLITLRFHDVFDDVADALSIRYA